MTKVVKNLSGLKSELNGVIQKVIKDKSVQKEIIDVYEKNIRKTVYDAYDPKEYKRRYSLTKGSNIKITVGNGLIEIENISKPNPKYGGTVNKNLPHLIEYGSGNPGGYFYDYKGKFEKSRPFTKNTTKDLSSNQQHKEAIKKGLKKYGIKVID